MAKVLGIDLGTTNSCMAVVDDQGRPKILPNSEGKSTTPSVILFRGGERIVGERAKRAAVAQIDNVTMLMKRHMCEEEWSYLDAEGKEHSVEELSATVLKKMKQDAEKELGEEITQAVITVPAYFGDLESSRTKTAGEIAGFEVLRILNEPTAAALSYGLDQAGKDQTVLVFDLGGGTFDVTIIRISGANITVLNTDGNKFLGGSNFDEELVSLFIRKFKDETGVDPTDDGNDLRVYQDFSDKAETTKIDLSADTEVFVGLSAAGKVLDLEVTRQEFESLISHFIDEAKETTLNSLKTAKLTWDGIDKILLVGGSTRIPAIREMMEKESGKSVESGINPDEVVAMGAAMAGAAEVGQTIRSETGAALDKITIIDVTGHSLGIIAMDSKTQKDISSIIIPCQSQIPAEGTKAYYTSSDNQTSVNVEVVQGEDPDPNCCDMIGEGFPLKGLPPKPKGEIEIQVTLSYDRDGLIHLKAVESATGKEIHADLQDPNRKTKLQIEKLRDDVSKVKIK